MASTRASSSIGETDRRLPPGFRSLLSIMEASHEEIVKRPEMDVVGIITDCQPPTECFTWEEKQRLREDKPLSSNRNNDFKMCLTLVDLSVEDYRERYQVKFNIFKKFPDMPPNPAVGQPIVITRVKLQLHGGLSLITSHNTQFSFFPSKLPKWPISSADDLPIPSYSSNHTSRGKPVKAEVAAYIALLQNTLRPDSIPTEIEYANSTTVAQNRSEKFRELKDIETGRFHDLIGQIVSIYNDRGKATVYLTDYTTNDLFYDKQRIDGSVGEGDEADEFGYLRDKKLKPQRTEDGKEWSGPSGKMSIQLTAWEDQANYFIDNVKEKDWVKISNVQVRISQMTGLLEGVVRNDRRNPNKILTQVLVVPEDPKSMDDRWKNAIRRMRQYEKDHKTEIKEQIGAAGAGTKRKAETDVPVKPPNSKKRREEKRRAAELKSKQDAERASVKDVFGEVAKTPSIRLNELVKSKVSSDPASKDPVNLTDILEYRPTIKLDDGTSFAAPFTNSKYRAYVRVTDYFPHNIADFAVGKKTSLYDALSDNESEDDSADDDVKNGDMTDFVDQYSGQWKWNWKFMIQVEDARRPDEDKGKPKPRIWLGVDNDSAQFLLNSDATNLRTDKAALDQIKEKLFILWGDLEERKTAYLLSQEGRILQSRTFAVDTGSPPASPPPPSSFQSSAPNGNSKAKFGGMPPDSDDEESSVPFATQQPLPPPTNPNSPKKLKRLRPAEAGNKLTEKLREIGQQAQNKPFEAAIREWGVETSPGNYQRAWGLIDTIIKY